MLLNLTEPQLRRLIELARKSQVSRDDARLVDYLMSRLNALQISSVEYDEIPF